MHTGNNFILQHYIHLKCEFWRCFFEKHAVKKIEIPVDHAQAENALLLLLCKYYVSRQLMALILWTVKKKKKN